MQGRASYLTQFATLHYLRRPRTALSSCTGIRESYLALHSVRVCVYLGNNIFVATHFWILLQSAAAARCVLATRRQAHAPLEVNMHFITANNNLTQHTLTINNLNVVAAAVAAFTYRFNYRQRLKFQISKHTFRRR